MRPLLTGGLTPRTMVFVSIEHVLMVASVTLAVVVLGSASQTDSWFVGALLWRASLIAAVLQFCSHYSDLYDLRTLKDRRDVVVSVIQTVGAACVILGILYYWMPMLVIGRGVVVVASVVIVVLVSGWRMVFDWVSPRLKPAERLLIVGGSSAAIDLATELYERRTELGVELVGFVDPDAKSVGPSRFHWRILGKVDDIPAIVREHQVDRVVVSLADARGKLSMDQLLAMKLNDGIRFDHLASVYETFTGKIAVENLRPSWLIFSEGFRKGRAQAFVKRALDILLSVVGLVLALPLLVLSAIAIRITSPGPALYHQRRVGKHGVAFTIHKFRSMSVDAEATTGAVWAVKGDPRVTPVGRFLRRTRLDEIPQLWNVLIGDMSFVGPRPERPEFVSDLMAQIPYYGQRHIVRPGLTGWAQVRHRYGSTEEDALQKLQYELFYIKNMSMAFDMFIVFETIKTVLVRRGS